MSTRELTCIGCPLGCAITVTMDGSTVTAVTGNTMSERRCLRQKGSYESDPYRNIDGPGERRHLPDGKRENSLRHSERQDFRLCQRLKGYHRQCTA